LVYSPHDVWHLHDVLRAQEAALSEAKLLTVWKLEQRLAPIIVQMTNTGFGFNLDGVAESADQSGGPNLRRQRTALWSGLTLQV